MIDLEKYLIDMDIIGEFIIKIFNIPKSIIHKCVGNQMVLIRTNINNSEISDDIYNLFNNDYSAFHSVRVTYNDSANWPEHLRNTIFLSLEFPNDELHEGFYKKTLFPILEKKINEYIE